MYRIMVVDDEEGIVNSLKRVLKPEGYEVVVFTEGGRAIEYARDEKVDLVISDYRMPKMDGVAFLTEFKQSQPDAMRLILSGYTDLDALMGAINQAEIYRFISKPWHDYDLKATISSALAHYEMLNENRRLADQIREQQSRLEQQRVILEKLESESPGITHVQWQEDGSIILGEE